MIPYATRTGTKRNLAALKAAGWGMLISADVGARWQWKEVPSGFKYAIDNGAWSAYQRKVKCLHRRGGSRTIAFSGDTFMRCLDKMADGAEWIVLPDVVCGGLASLDLSLWWLDVVRPYGRPMLIPAQDGMENHHLSAHIGSDVGIFVGGSTAWKETTLARWSELAKSHRAYCHVGRVNTLRRIRMCRNAGVDSIDGTSASRFAVNVPKLTRAVRQGHLWD